MIVIKRFDPEIEISTTGSDSGSVLLLEKSQRELIRWFFRNKPDMICEIICEECPEHMEYAGYCENKAERRK